MSKLLIYSYLKQITPLRIVARKLKWLVGRHREDIWFLEGRERISKEPLSVLFSGGMNSRNYIIQLVFDESSVEIEHVRTWKYGFKNRLLKLARTANGRHDLAILEMEGSQPVTDTGEPMFRVPCWVGGEKNLHVAAEFAQRSKHIKSDIRRIRKNRLNYRVTSEPVEFDQFYHSMYLPHIQRIFGDHSYIMTYEEMQEAIPHCELFLITQDGEDIAGGILVYNGSESVRGWSLGVKNGDDRWVREGALAAFEHLQTDYLSEKGFSRLHRGSSRPFLKDGALCFKKNRGMEITNNSDKSFFILPVRDCAGVRGFLLENPFIYEDQGELKGAVFVSGEKPSEDDIARLFHNVYIPGLKCLTLFSLSARNEGSLFIETLEIIEPNEVSKTT